MFIKLEIFLNNDGKFMFIFLENFYLQKNTIRYKHYNKFQLNLFTNNK